MNNANARRIIGIDLGTTYSLCSALVDGRLMLLPNALGETLTPSAVAIDERGAVLVGAVARARATTHPGHTALGFKRLMGTDKLTRLGKQEFRPEQLSALVLAELKRDAEHALGCVVDEAVITVPAYFGELQRSATRVAGEIAGLRVERIINEPTAAALAYGLHARDRELRAIVLDLGGGTFDVTVLQIEAGVIEVQSSAGNAHLGGDDFTELLALEVVRRVRSTQGIDVTGDEGAMARVREAAEQAKRMLSVATWAQLLVPQVRVDRERIDLELTITRAEAEALWQPLLLRMRAPIVRALSDAAVEPGQLDEVLLVGGASRIPCVSQLFATLLGREPCRELPTDEAVALGAAVQAGLRERDAAVEDMVVTDIAPFSLGLATGTRHGHRLVTGLFAPIIDRGTVIPVSRSERLVTIEDGQREVRIEVFQGEHSLCSENTKLGQYTVRDIPAAPAGEAQVDVRFTYDLNGLLEVESTVVGTDKKHVLVIEQRPGMLSREQIAQARAAMERLKHHPRETLPNRTALAQAEATFLELIGPARDELGHAIAAFRMALETQHPGPIELTRVRLTDLTKRARTQRPGKL